MDASAQAALDYFPPDYFNARTRFLDLARNRGAQIATHPIAARGPGGETLAIDTAYLGAAAPRRLLLIVSGTHGVEGFAGSALQQQWLARLVPSRLAAGGGCLLIHALNPYGFAWRRRANERNVDLNRNALARFPGPHNPGYRRLERWLNPPCAPKWIDSFWVQGALLLLRHGFGPLQQAVVEGQYEYPQGLFYGGAQPEPSTRILNGLLADARWRHVERVVAIDIHTGVGRYGACQLLVDVAPSSPAYRALAQWFGGAVASSQPADDIAYRVSGGVTESIARHFGPERAYAGVLEFGTVSPTRVLAALRRENRAYHYSPHTRAHARAAKALQEVFCPRDAAWRARVLAEGGQMLERAERGCFSTALGRGETES